MFGKKNKTLFDYISDHNPYNDIEDLIKPTYPEGAASSSHLELESLVEEYFDILHPLVADYINSYASMVDKLGKEVSEARQNIDNARRQLVFEQQNVNDLNDQLRDLRKQNQELIVENRDLSSRLEDEREVLESNFAKERKTLELLAETQLSGSVSVDEIVKKLQGNMVDSDEVVRLRKKIEDLENQIKKEREENEAIQAELSMSFMQKAMKSDEIIKNLKARLNE